MRCTMADETSFVWSVELAKNDLRKMKFASKLACGRRRCAVRRIEQEIDAISVQKSYYEGLHYFYSHLRKKMDHDYCRKRYTLLLQE
mmetsp:Transcript_670/g.1359  ORF Transcript_670/g.1359 Transcript_670/m.1359 type:complete len:87 (-) Transcript_670:22-282(-)